MAKTFKVTIEEIISQEFTVTAEDLDDAIGIAEHNYDNGIFVVDSGNLNPTSRSVMAEDPDTKEQTDWCEF